MQLSNTEDKTGGACGRRGRGGMHERFGREIPTERAHFEELSINGRIMLERTSKLHDRRAWNGFVLIRMGKIGFVLRRR
jgi:hypothetical protein